jgi:hypothetical protein
LEVQLEHEVAEIVGHAEAVVEEARLLVLEDPGESVGRGVMRFADMRGGRCALAE